MIRKILQALRCRSFRPFFVLLLMLAIVVPSAAPRDTQEQAAPDPPSGQTNPSLRRERSVHSEAVDKWGEITIAQPKIWQYERVNAMLDGLLRDVEGVSVADLTRLDPSAPNAGAIRFIEDALGVAVQYNQAAQVNTRNTLQTWQAQHDVQVEQLKQYNDYVTSLNTQRAQIAGRLFAANNTIATIQGQAGAGGQFTSDQQRQLTDAQDRVTTLKTQLNDVNSMITTAGSPPTLTAPPTVQGTSAELPAQPPLSSFTDLMNSLPDGVKKGLNSALQSPSYPASKQLDNFITLLHERLAREISVQQDDLMRDPENLAFLVQFDVGLYPSSKARNHMARVEFELTNCPGCKVYSLYPGQSSYNVANYQGASHRRSLTGNLLTLIGLGITSSYQRQENSLQGSLVQSVYISGFQDDVNGRDETSPGVAQRFGWYYSAAPFDQYVTPGIRSTFALITVPSTVVRCFQEKTRNQTDPGCPSNEGSNFHPQLKTRQYPISLKVNADWAKRDNPLYQKSGWFSKRYLGKEHRSQVERSLDVELPGTLGLNQLPAALLADQRRIHVLRMEYNTVKTVVFTPAATSSHSPAPSPAPTLSPASSASPGTSLCPKSDCTTLLLSLDTPIDPNLVVTVHGNLMQRVRDWRGRSTSVLPPAQSESDLAQASGGAQIKTQKPISRSLMEADQLQPDSWFAVTSHDLLLNISRNVASEDEFPVIQLSMPGKQTLVIPNDLRQDVTELIFDGFRLLPSTSSEIQQYIKRTYGGGLETEPTVAQGPQKRTLTLDEQTLQGGPYPYSTFGPLFRGQVTARRFYAWVGQTGEDLIVGFLNSAESASESNRDEEFLETHTQVILEDPNMDIAWSLSCNVQGNELVCKLPIDAIRQSYIHIVHSCPNPAACPAIGEHIKRLQNAVEDATKRALKEAAKSEERNPSSTVLEQARSNVKTSDIAHWLNRAFVSNLQVWVNQADPKGDGAFWSLEPASIGLLPLSKDFNGAFKPWHFYSTDTTGDQLSVEACNYLSTDGTVCSDGKCPIVNYLTPVDHPIANPETGLPLIQDMKTKACIHVQLPTLALLTSEVVLQVEPSGNTDEAWTAALPSSQLRPAFGKPIVKPVYASSGPDGSYSVIAWDVRIPVKRMYCQDGFDISRNVLNEIQQTLDRLQNQLQVDQRTALELLDGTTSQNFVAMENKFALGAYVNKDNTCTPSWWARQLAGQIQLHFMLPKQTAAMLPSELHLTRSPNKKDGANDTNEVATVSVARLPNLRELVLPTKLKVEPLGDNQFALRGPNAGAIDAVALQYGGKALTYPAGSAGDFAVVDTSLSPVAPSSSQRAGKTRAAAAENPKPAAAARASSSPGSTCCRPTGAAPPMSRSPGSSTNPQPAAALVGSNATPTNASRPRQTTPAAKPALSPGTYAVLPLIRNGEKYIPLAVTDDAGAPLVFTKKKPAEANGGKNAEKADETITITKITAKAAPTESGTGKKEEK